MDDIKVLQTIQMLYILWTYRYTYIYKDPKIRDATRVMYNLNSPIGLFSLLYPLNKTEGLKSFTLRIVMDDRTWFMIKSTSQSISVESRTSMSRETYALGALQINSILSCHNSTLIDSIK